MEKHKRIKPVEQRFTIIVDGEPRRLGWVAENRPEILIKDIAGGGTIRQDALFSALAKAGWGRQRMVEEVGKHPEWEVNPNALSQQ